MSLTPFGVALILTLGATGCTRDASANSATPTSPTFRDTTAPTSPAISSQLSTKRPETVIVLPDLGGVAWTCRGTAGASPRFRTTFTAMNATEQVGYSLGTTRVSATLQPGQDLSTPFTRATHHVWTIKQRIDPYDSIATITIDLKADPVVACVNPTVTVSRMRAGNATASG